MNQHVYQLSNLDNNLQVLGMCSLQHSFWAPGWFFLSTRLIFKSKDTKYWDDQKWHMTYFCDRLHCPIMYIIPWLKKVRIKTGTSLSKYICDPYKLWLIKMINDKINSKTNFMFKLWQLHADYTFQWTAPYSFRSYEIRPELFLNKYCNCN